MTAHPGLRPFLSHAEGKRAVFLDKDGTLIEDVPYNVDPAKIVLAPGAREACAAFREAGYKLIVVSNQSGVARGLFAEEALGGVRERLEALLGLTFDDFLWCPHAPNGSCACRKPEPGMLVNAAARLGVDLTASWMIGDILNDVEAGNRVGCRTILIDNGNETEWLPGRLRSPTHRAADMLEAAALVLDNERLAA